MSKKTNKYFEDLKHEILVLYVMSTLESLRAKGYVEGGVTLKQDGVAFGKWLDEHGFKPTQYEIESVMSVLQEGVV